MKDKHSQPPPALATWLLHLCNKNQDALVGDLFERFDEGQSAGWFWRQVLIAISFGVSSELRTRWLGGHSAKVFLTVLMALNALVFFFGALLHAGVEFGPFHQQLIVPAIVVEILCGSSLAWGVTALSRGRPSAGRVALTTNLLAAAGVSLGVVPRVLRHRAAPVIALDHRVMLALIVVSLFIIFFARLNSSTTATNDRRSQRT